MRRKTQTKPHYFKVGEEQFKSVKFGYLDGNELLLKYMPKLIKIFRIFKSNKKEEQEQEQDLELGQEQDLELGQEKFLNINIEELVDALGENTLKNLAEDLFEKTYLEETKENWVLIDPQNFDNTKEMFSVAQEVFNHNYPDIFGGDNDLPEHEVSQKKKTLSKSPQKSEPSKKNIKPNVHKL